MESSKSFFRRELASITEHAVNATRDTIQKDPNFVEYDGIDGRTVLHLDTSKTLDYVIVRRPKLWSQKITNEYPSQHRVRIAGEYDEVDIGLATYSCPLYDQANGVPAVRSCVELTLEPPPFDGLEKTIVVHMDHGDVKQCVDLFIWSTFLKQPPVAVRNPDRPSAIRFNDPGVVYYRPSEPLNPANVVELRLGNQRRFAAYDSYLHIPHIRVASDSVQSWYLIELQSMPIYNDSTRKDESKWVVMRRGAMRPFDGYWF